MQWEEGGRKGGQEPEGSNKNNKGCSGRREEGREDRSLRGAIRTTKGAVGGGRKEGRTEGEDRSLRRSNENN